MTREDFLRRVRDGLKSLPDDDRTITLSNRRTPPELSLADPTIVELFIERLEHHGARVERITEAEIPAAVRGALRTYRAKSVVTPNGLPDEWLDPWAEDAGNTVMRDHQQLTPEELDDADAVVTTCAGAVADAGAVVLDGGPGQGRSETLVPTCHICVVRTPQIDSSLPEVLDKLDSRRPITWCGGPTAPADAKGAPGQGRHRQRQLIVLIVDEFDSP
ncbi:LutC/YkgG family protein [Nocardia alni]|uniref:LutC/YkgG family protein n=1 Tax=Nocardia alni TaxID=2815723 RepID=UPI001C2396E5|nr:LUD domain-containing protein [Nocardia alni]